LGFTQLHFWHGGNPEFNQCCGPGHRFDADPDPEPYFHVDADPDPDPSPSFIHVGKSETCFTFSHSNATLESFIFLISVKQMRHKLVFWKAYSNSLEKKFNSSTFSFAWN
jgi:hypothetical protein